MITVLVSDTFIVDTYDILFETKNDLFHLLINVFMPFLYNIYKFFYVQVLIHFDRHLTFFFISM